MGYAAQSWILLPVEPENIVQIKKTKTTPCEHPEAAGCAFCPVCGIEDVKRLESVSRRAWRESLIDALPEALTCEHTDHDEPMDPMTAIRDWCSMDQDIGFQGAMFFIPHRDRSERDDEELWIGFEISSANNYNWDNTNHDVPIQHITMLTNSLIVVLGELGIDPSTHPIIHRTTLSW